MTAEPDLLPLPEMVEVDKHLPTGVRIYAYDANTLKDYARANVAHATAPLQAEIEALRAQLDEQCRLHAIGMERELALITERDRLRVELRCLREQYDERTACMIVHRGAALACSAAVRAAYSEEHERAERLAEALREAADMLLADYPETARRLRATLNPAAAQEGKESFWPKLPGSGGPDWTGHD